MTLAKFTHQYTGLSPTLASSFPSVASRSILQRPLLLELLVRLFAGKDHHVHRKTVRAQMRVDEVNGEDKQDGQQGFLAVHHQNRVQRPARQEASRKMAQTTSHILKNQSRSCPRRPPSNRTSPSMQSDRTSAWAPVPQTSAGGQSGPARPSSSPPSSSAPTAAPSPYAPPPGSRCLSGDTETPASKRSRRIYGRKESRRSRPPRSPKAAPLRCR